MILRNECTEDAASMVPNPIRWYQCSWWCFSAAAVANDKESSLERVGKIAIASKQARIGDWGAAAVPGRVANGSWRRVGRSPRKHRTESIFNCCETNERIMRPQRRGGESSNVAAAVRERLHSTVGLSPSMEWLKDCLSSLDETNNENRHHHHNNDKNVEALAMDVLQQVLVHDLRDIVRTTTTTTLEDDDDTAPTTTNLATHSHQHMIAMLQRAVQSSLSPPYKATLPASFRLMVQVEEWVDVAKNAAARLEETTTTTTKRCFKISYSHGSPPESTPLAGRDENSPNNAPLVAMELAPLIGCSTISAAAGLKVVLVGPLTVRHGMAGWTPANALILGGAVERLAAARRHAVQRARAGHGVDPTVQALIWTANTVPDDDETGGTTNAGMHACLDFCMENVFVGWFCWLHCYCVSYSTS